MYVAYLSVSMCTIIYNIQSMLIKLCNSCNSNLGTVVRNQDIPLNIPLALQHWNRRAGIVFEESARRLSRAYSSWPPIAFQKLGFSWPAKILIAFVNYTRPLSPLLEIFQYMKWERTYGQASVDVIITGTLHFGKKISNFILLPLWNKFFRQHL